MDGSKIKRRADGWHDLGNRRDSVQQVLNNDRGELNNL